MNQVQISEVVEALHEVGGILLTSKYTVLANRIKAHGIAPPDGMRLVPREPTAEMIYDFMATGLRHAEYIQAPTVIEIAQGYKAMLAATPKHRGVL